MPFLLLDDVFKYMYLCGRIINNTMKKKCFLMLLTLVLSLLSTTAFAYTDYDAEIDGIYYCLFDETEAAIVVDGTNKYSGNVVIPSSVTYNGSTYNVTRICSRAFYNCSGLTSVTILKSVTSIDDRAFEGCSGLTSITIPNSVTSIGDSVFDGCSGLTSITIPNSVTSIGRMGFWDRSSLTSIQVENGNSKYDSRNGCNAIIETATNALLFGCQNTTIPSNVTSIGEYAFYGCIGLTSTIIPNSVTSIGRCAFSCSGLTSIIIPSSLTTLYNSTFSGCSNLKTATVRASIMHVGSFYESGLEFLTIGKEVREIIQNRIDFQSNSTWNRPFTNLKHLVIEDGDDALTIEGVYKDWDYDFDSYYNPFADNPINTIHIGRNISTRNFPQYFWGADHEDTGNGIYLAIPKQVPQLTSASIGSKVTSIYETMFCNCTSLTSITIPSSVTLIDSRAFYGCSGLTSLTIPNSVTSIGISAFEGCSGLTSLTIPNSVTSIGNAAFHGTAWYNNQPDGMVYAGRVAYSYKGTMEENTEIILEDSTLGIAGSAFGRCSGLTSITIPNSVTSIGSYAFYGCSGLTSVTIPNNVTLIDAAVFRGCSGLTSITIPNSVTSIGQEAFRECSGLTSINIPNSVTSIGFDAFAGCNSLVSVIVDIKPPLSIYSSTFTNRANATLYVPVGCKAAYEAADYWKEFGTIVEMEAHSPAITFADNNVKAICVVNWDNNGDGELSEEEAAAVTDLGTVFKGNTDITSFNELQYFTGLTEIGNSAFYDCSGLTSITIPNSVTSIGYSAFEYCYGLTSVTIPNSVTSIGDYAFDGCSALTSVISEIETPFTFGSFAFSGISSLCTLTVPYGTRDAYIAAGWTTNIFKGGIIEMEAPPPTIEFADNNVKAICVANWDTNEDGELSEAEAATVTDLGTVFKGNTSITSFNELQYFTRLTEIPSQAFMGCSNLTSVVIPDNITSIGYSAFDDCYALASINLPSTITFIDGAAFSDCHSLTSITLPEGIPSIGEWCFDNCTGLTEIIIPNSVTMIGGEAFLGCTGLISIVIPENVTSISESTFNGCSGLTSVTIPESVASIGGYAFYGCENLTSVSLPGSVGTIGERAFQNCRNLVSINIPDGITEIKGYTFCGCGSLKSIEIPESVTSIGELAFYACDNLIFVSVKNVNPVAIIEDVFSTRANALLYIPAGSKAAYEAADYWKDFKRILEMAVIDNEETYYIQNVETGLFLGAGNAWGTHAVLKNEGLPVKFTQLPDGSYTIYFLEGSQNDQLLFRDNESNVYVDYNSTSSNTPRWCKYWTITTAGEEGTYLIQSLITDSRYGQQVYPRTYLGNNPTKEAYDQNGNTLGVYNDVDGDILDVEGMNVTWRLVAESAYNNEATVYASSATLLANGNTNLSISLRNDEDIVMAEFYLKLPTGISIAEDREGDPDCTLNSERSNGHALEVSQAGDGVYHFLVYSNSNNALHGNDGELVSVRLTCAGNVSPGDYEGVIRNILLSGSDNNNIRPASTNFTITVSDAVLGDVNDDGSINGLDVVKMVDHIMGREPAGFDPFTSDINSDGKINGVDLVKLVRLVMEQEEPEEGSSGIKALTPVSSETMTLESFGKDIRLGAESSEDFILVQCLVRVSEGMTMQYVTTDDEHTAAWLDLGDGRYSVLAYSTRNARFSDNTSLLTFRCSGEGSVSIGDVLLVDALRNGRKASKADIATDIREVGNEEPGTVYDLQGRKLNDGYAARKGVYIVNGKKVLVR